MNNYHYVKPCDFWFKIWSKRLTIPDPEQEGSKRIYSTYIIHNND